MQQSPNLAMNAINLQYIRVRDIINGRLIFLWRILANTVYTKS